MSWQNPPGSQPGPNANNSQSSGQPPNRDSFSSRITSFADIADISIDHLSYNDTSATGALDTTPCRPPLRNPPPPRVPPSQHLPFLYSNSTQPQYGYNVTNTPTNTNLRPSESNVSLQSAWDGQGRVVQGRESMVSLQSYYDPHPSPQLQWSPSANAYISTAPVNAPTSYGGRGNARNGYSLAFTGEHEAIAEEEYDLSLLRSAAPMGNDSSREPLMRPVNGPPAANSKCCVEGLGPGRGEPKGKIIEVVIEEPTGVDISAMVGPEGLDDNSDDSNRPPPPPPKKAVTEVFYPQPNWKPFSMRWPYLSALVFLSLGLAATQEIIYQLSKKEPLIKFTSPDEINPGVYFALKFLPTIISVTYGVLWQVTDYDVKRLEAFYQLSREKGALAGESINVDYMTSKTFLRPFRALKLKHYAVAVSSLGSVLAVSLVPTFGAASILLTPNRLDRIAHPDLEKAVIINAIWSRLLTVTLAICAVCASLLFYLLQTRRSGIGADVKGIAGLASMAVVCHILMDFKDMDTAKHEDIHKKLKLRRYILRNSALAPYDETPTSSSASMVARPEEDRFQHTHLSENPHPLMLRAAGYVPFVVGVIVFMGFVPAMIFTKATVVTDRAPWVITALAVGIKLGWGTLDTDILTVLLTSLATVDGRDFLAVVARPGSTDTDDGINSGQETVLSFWFSLVAAALILVYMGVISTLVFARRRHPFLPRQPNTIASVLAYIHQSKMLYDFVNTSTLSHADMDEKLEGLGKKYGLGWFQGRDGQTHCGVDQEELTGNICEITGALRYMSRYPQDVFDVQEGTDAIEPTHLTDLFVHVAQSLFTGSARWEIKWIRCMSVQSTVNPGSARVGWAVT
ncbi:unnamed protein product [Parascedosporium putredinis]|uniref:Uncharacterized protein n=1 Tax=Parascedosporium putredinis TaxID=1442378 RepID=A0A9P1H399_9PEZI|nr:unnamed protein product [Parascedosporium putredinis]CAI7995547.1 unnamed protein product [Parascedosporium putredinis]